MLDLERPPGGGDSKQRHGLAPESPAEHKRPDLTVAAAMTVLAFFADDLQWILIDATPEGLRS